MQIAPEIQFRGFKPTPQIQSIIEKHLADLEQRWGRVTSCRVVVTSPGRHRRTGGPYSVHIQLALPGGREVNVERTHSVDDRQSDLTFAVQDAFRHARRQLQDEVRRSQGQVKAHEVQPIGTVLRLDPSGEFGFLQTSDGREIYFHRNSVLNDGFARLRAGTQVSFAEEIGEQGPQASTVRIAGRHKLRV